MDKVALDKASYVINGLGLNIKPDNFIQKFISGDIEIPDAYKELLLEEFIVTKYIEGYEIVLGRVYAFSEEDAKTKLKGTTSYLLG